jgi:hypothetical protein
MARKIPKRPLAFDPKALAALRKALDCLADLDFSEDLRITEDEVSSLARDVGTDLPRNVDDYMDGIVEDTDPKRAVPGLHLDTVSAAFDTAADLAERLDMAGSDLCSIAKQIGRCIEVAEEARDKLEKSAEAAVKWHAKYGIAAQAKGSH